MIKEILTSAAIPHKPARFPDPPAQTYAVYFDSTSYDGPDIGAAEVVTHEFTVELYAASVADGAAALARLQSQLNANSIRCTTQGWYWLNSIQRYQEIVEFTYIEKILQEESNE